MTLSATRLDHDESDRLSEEDFDIDLKNETQDQVELEDYGSEAISSRNDGRQPHAQDTLDTDLQPRRQQRFVRGGRKQQKKRSLKWVILTTIVVLLGAGTYGVSNYLGISIKVHMPDNSLSTLAELANGDAPGFGQHHNSKAQPINAPGSRQENGLPVPEMTSQETIPVIEQGGDQSPISPELSKQAEALLAEDMPTPKTDVVPDPVVTKNQNVNPQAVSLPVADNSVLVLEEPLSQRAANVPDVASFEAVVLDISLMKEQMNENAQLITDMRQTSEKAFSAMNDHLIKTEKHITALREEQRNLSQSLESSKSDLDAELTKLKKENQEFRNSLGGIWRRIYNKPFLPDWHVGAVSKAQDGSSNNKAVLVGPNKEMVIVVVGETFKGAKIRSINLKEKTVKTSKGTIK